MWKFIHNKKAVWNKHLLVAIILQLQEMQKQTEFKKNYQQKHHLKNSNNNTYQINTLKNGVI